MSPAELRRKARDLREDCAYNTKWSRDWTTLGRRARWAREAAGLSIGQIAGLLHVSPDDIEQYEADTLSRAVRKVRLTADLPGYYGVSLRWLATGESDPE